MSACRSASSTRRTSWPTSSRRSTPRDFPQEERSLTMIDLYTAPTGNGMRAAVALAESGLPYKVHKLDLAKGESKTPDYLKINPAGSIPSIVDGSTTVTQSGAI